MGTFLKIKTVLIPFPKLSFLEYKKASLDMSEVGQRPGIFYGNFKIICPAGYYGEEISIDNYPHIHYENGLLARVKRFF